MTSTPNDMPRNQLARLIAGAGVQPRVNLTGDSGATGTDLETAVATLPDFTTAGKFLELITDGDGDLVASWEDPPGGSGTPDGGEGDIQWNKAGAFGASPGRLTWTEGADETDSYLTVDGEIIAYGALLATVLGTHAIQSAGLPLNIVLSDELQLNFDGGTSGDVLTSNGTGSAPTWETPTGGTYTDEQVRDVIAAALFMGAGINITVNDALDSITIASTITQYTDELAQDAVAAMALDTSSTAWTYSDATPSLALNVKDEYIQDTVAALIVAGANITVTYNDGAGTLTIEGPGAAQPGKSWMSPLGPTNDNTTTQSGITNSECRARMLGEAPWAVSNVIVRLKCTQAYISQTWTELAIAKASGTNQNDLTTVGFVSLASITNTLGEKDVTIAVTGVAAGDTLFLLHACNASTSDRFRAHGAIELSGIFKSRASTRPSTMAAATTFTDVLVASVGYQVYYRFS